MQNNRGATWTARRHVWQGQGLTAEIACDFSFGSVCDSTVHVFSQAMRDRRQRETEGQTQELVRSGRKL
jgi:hypothetical protein